MRAFFSKGACLGALVATLGCGAAADGQVADGGVSDVPKDASPGADAAMPHPATQVPAHVQLVHAAYGVDTVRLCFSTSSPSAEPHDNVVPLTNFPGLVPGGAANLVKSPALLDPFLVDAWKLALIEQSQQTLSCSVASQLGSSVNMTPLAPVSLLPGPNLLAVVGCPANAPNATLAICGADPKVASLALGPIALTSSLTGAWGADFVMLSRTLAAVSVGFGPLGACPTSRLALPTFGQKVSFDGFSPPTKDYDTTGLVLCDAMGRVAREWSWTAMQVATAPSATPAEHYGNTGLYAFTVVGEEGVSDARYAPHALALVYQITQ